MKLLLAFVSTVLLFLDIQGQTVSVSPASDFSKANSLVDSIKILNDHNLKTLYSGDLQKADSINAVSRKLIGNVENFELAFENERLNGLLWIFTLEYDSALSLYLDLVNEAARKDREEFYHRAKYYTFYTNLFLSKIDEAKKGFEEVLVYYRSQPETDSLMTGQILTHLGLILYSRGELEETEKMLLNAADLLKPDSYDHKVALGECYNLLAALYRRKGVFTLSASYYQRTIKLYEATGRLLNKPILLSGYAQLYMELSNREEAFKLLDQALRISKKINQPRETSFVYQITSKCYEEIGDYKNALDFYKKFKFIRDSISTIEKRMEILSMEEDSRRELEKIRLSNLEQQLEIQRSSNERQKAWIFLIVIICLYLLGSLIVFQRLVRQKNSSQEVLEAKNRELENKTYQIRQTQDKLIKSEKMALLGRISAGIAHELNTPIGAIKGNLELIDDVQKREVEIFGNISTTVSQHDFKLLVELIVESVKKGKEYAYADNEEAIREIWIQFLNRHDIPEKEDVIELMTDLKIDENPEKFLPLLKNKSNVAVLELVLYINNRYTSIKTALDALKRAQKILSSFKTYSFKRGWEDYKQFDLKENIETILSLHKNILKDIKIELNVKGSDTNLRGVTDELSQVWTNLITNAAYAMDYKGRLWVNIKGENDKITLTVEDTGGGIKADKADIFEPFYTTKPEGEGSGLGLDISRQIIQKHNGTISWENTAQGAKFTIVLPKDEKASLQS